MDEEYYRPTREERKEVTLGIRAAVGIRHGVQCTNFAQDQQHIIFLLNEIPNTAGGTLYATGPTNFKAPRDGYCDPGLSNLIAAFQRFNGLGADGVVDPDGPTLKTLNKLSTSKNLAKPSQKSTISQQQAEALNELLDVCYSLMTGAGFGANAASLGSELRINVKDIEAEMSKLGIPNRERRHVNLSSGNLSFAFAGMPPGVQLPVANNVGAIRGVGAGIGLLEYLLAGLAALVLFAGLYLLLRKLLKTLKLYLLLAAKTAVELLTEIKLVVARAESSTNKNRCRTEDIGNFFEATNNFRNALEAQTTAKSVLGPVVRAWWNALKRLFFCLEESVMWTILKILTVNIGVSLTLWEFLVYYMQ